MKLLLVLFSWATFIIQPSDPIYLDQNGVTVKATSEAIVGQTYQFQNKTYLVVDNELLRSMVNDDADLTLVVTSFVTDMSYLFYKRESFNADISSWDTSDGSISVTSDVFSFRVD